MGRGKAFRRSKTEAKKVRAKVILRKLGYSEASLDKRASRFVESRFGCDCSLCRNPRKLYKGKASASLTLKEYHDILARGMDEGTE
jgi:hypothetical protein